MLTTVARRTRNVPFSVSHSRGTYTMTSILTNVAAMSALQTLRSIGNDMETTQGRVVIELRPDLAPQHVERIKLLAREKFYDGIVFHRVIDGFMAQAGCPDGRGTGGSKHPNLPAEFNDESHVRGICSMARSSMPNSANSQFFIVFDNAKFLDRQYTVWGKVVEGMENVDKIKRGEPVVNPDKIVSMRVQADIA